MSQSDTLWGDEAWTGDHSNLWLCCEDRDLGAVFPTQCRSCYLRPLCLTCGNADAGSPAHDGTVPTCVRSFTEAPVSRRVVL